MTLKRFALSLVATSVGTALINFALQYLSPTLERHATIAWWSLYLFIVLSIFMFFVGRFAALSPSKYLFIQVVMAFIFFKMMTAVGIIWVYKKRFHPESTLFIIPFFVAYIAFTFFEIYFMTQLARLKKQ